MVNASGRVAAPSFILDVEIIQVREFQKWFSGIITILGGGLLQLEDVKSFDIRRDSWQLAKFDLLEGAVIARVGAKGNCMDSPS